MLKTTFTLIVLFASGIAFAQTPNAQWMNDAFGRPLTTNVEDKEIEGNSKLFTQFEEAVVKLQSGKQYKGKVQFDKYFQEWTFQSNDKVLAFVDMPKEVYVVNLKSIFRPIPGVMTKKGKQVFGEVIAEGNYELIKYLPISLDVFKEYNATAETKRLVDQKPVHYLVKENKSAAWKSGVGDWKEVLGETFAKAEQIWKSKNYKSKSEPDLIAFVQSL